MLMWRMIMITTLVLLALAVAYLAKRICSFEMVQTFLQHDIVKEMWFGGVIVLAATLNLVNAMVCTVYLAMFWLFFDVLYFGAKKFFDYVPPYGYFGAAAISFTIIILLAGWYINHHVWKTEYHLTTEKKVEDLRIALIADSHIGTTFDAEGFGKHLQTIQKENPDMLIIAGDYVDDDTSKEDMIKASALLGKMKTTYGTFFAFGNHDKGYYGPAYRGFGSADLIHELEKNNVVVLRDENKLINDMIYVIGRRDYSVEKERSGKRLSAKELTADLDKSKYILVIDHQPADYSNEAEAEVDLVLSGHTHGGQLFPFNYVGKWIKANDRIYGYEKRCKTDFIVTSGISDWTIKFKTGTKSEFVMIYLNSKAEK